MGFEAEVSCLTGSRSIRLIFLRPIDIILPTAETSSA